MKLVIAEKPSVAKTIANVLGASKREDGYYEGNGWIVSYCYGHLAEYIPPDAYDEKYKKWRFEDLPIIPENWKMSVADDKRQQFNILKGLLKRDDIEYVVNACDAGREGELIFNDVYELSKSHIPVKRLWISSMEDSTIKYAFKHLKDGSDYDNLKRAAICRAKADWLVGMNSTRAYSSKYNETLTIGRVQTPTLAMIVERQQRIDNFVEQPYWIVSLTANGLTVFSSQFQNEQDAERLAEICQGKDAIVTEATKQKKKAQPPRLYDLTTLQREANRFFGYTAQDTLNVVQNLYENKLVTYPRTDSQYITDDMQDTVRDILKQLPNKVPCLKNVKIGNNIIRNVNNAKVTDHTALLPTVESLQHDISRENKENRNIYYLICQRLAQAVSDECMYEDTHVTVDCEGNMFKAHGKKILSPGFRDIDAAFRAMYKNASSKDKSDTDKEESIPSWVRRGADMPNVVVDKEQHKTSPPKPYTEDTLLSAMETAGNKEFEKETEKKGLGTPATRASIIERLLRGKVPYAERKGKTIVPTEAGKALIEVVSDTVKSASMTAEWENTLLQVEKGKADADEWLNGICNFVRAILKECEAIPVEQLNRFDTREVIGTCPACGADVVENKQCFGCSNRGCKFALWKDNKYLESMKKKIDKQTAKKLLSDRRCHMTGLHSKKTGKTFDADLLLSVDDLGRAQFNLEFPKREKINN